MGQGICKVCALTLPWKATMKQRNKAKKTRIFLCYQTWFGDMLNVLFIFRILRRPGGKAGLRGFTDSLRSDLIHDGSAVRITMLQLSAFNTPQFDWARNRMPKRARPVPPICQPEIAGRAIVWAAAHHRRELWVGWPAVKAILSTYLVPGLGDQLAARSAYDGQQADEPASGGEGNLMQPVAGRQGAHGRFDAKARRHSWHLWFAMHRLELPTVTVLSLAAVAVVFTLAR